MMLTLKAKPSWLFETGPRGRSPDSEWTCKNSHRLEWSGTTHINLCPQCFLPFTSYFYHHAPWLKLLWQIFDKLFYNAVFCTHIGFSFIVFFFLFSKDHSLVLFTAVFYRVMKLLLGASGVQSLLKCVCMKLLCSCLVCVLVVYRYFRFNWNPNVYVSIALRRMKSGVLHCLSDLIWLRVWRT